MFFNLQLTKTFSIHLYPLWFYLNEDKTVSSWACLRAGSLVKLELYGSPCMEGYHGQICFHKVMWLIGDKKSCLVFLDNDSSNLFFLLFLFMLWVPVYNVLLNMELCDFYLRIEFLISFALKRIYSNLLCTFNKSFSMVYWITVIKLKSS